MSKSKSRIRRAGRPPEAVTLTVYVAPGEVCPFCEGNTIHQITLWRDDTVPQQERPPAGTEGRSTINTESRSEDLL